MSATLYIPTCLTFSTIREGVTAEQLAAMNTFLVSVGLDPLPNDSTSAVGKQNPFVLSLNDFDMGGAAFLRTNAMTGLATCGPITNFEHMPLEYVTLIVGIGGDLTGFQVFAELDDPNVDCPFAPSQQDEEGNLLPNLSWLEWAKANSDEIQQYGGKFYKSLATSQEWLRATDWVPLYAAGQLVVKSKQEYQKIQADNAPVEA